MQLLQAARIEVQDVIVTDNLNGGTIALNHRGLFQVESYLAFKVETKAATNIQRIWRGYITRKRLLNKFLAESVQIENQRKHHQQQPQLQPQISVKNIAEKQRQSLPPPPTEMNRMSLQQLQPAALSLPETGHLEAYVYKLSSMYYNILHAQRPPSVFL
jgi:hypothetical protein